MCLCYTIRGQHNRSFPLPRRPLAVILPPGAKCTALIGAQKQTRRPTMQLSANVGSPLPKIACHPKCISSSDGCGCVRGGLETRTPGRRSNIRAQHPMKRLQSSISWVMAWVWKEEWIGGIVLRNRR